VADRGNQLLIERSINTHANCRAPWCIPPHDRGNPFSHAPQEISENLAEFSFFLISFPREILSSDGTQVAASIVRQRR